MPTAAIWLDLLARYQSAVDAYEERSDAVSACLAEGSIASDEEITAEQITRERLIVARSALWCDWSDPYKYEPKRAWTEFC